MDPRVKIETKRLILTPYTGEEVERLHAVLSDPVTMSYYPEPFTREKSEAWLKRSLDLYAVKGYGRYAIYLKDNGEYIGDVGFFDAVVNGREEVDLGYILHRDYWHKGYATEAAQACIDLARKEAWFNRVVIQMAHENVPSRRVAERLGAKLETNFIHPRNRDLPTHLFVIECSQKESGDYPA